MTAIADPAVEMSDGTRRSNLNDDEEEEESITAIFNVKEAVPPTDYDAPYS